MYKHDISNPISCCDLDMPLSTYHIHSDSLPMSTFLGPHVSDFLGSDFCQKAPGISLVLALPTGFWPFVLVGCRQLGHVQALSHCNFRSLPAETRHRSDLPLPVVGLALSYHCLS